MAKPPLEAGAVNVTTAFVFPGVALSIVGAPGNVDGMTPTDTEAPVPIELIATTVNVYEVPFAKPVTVMGELGAVAVKPPTLDVTLYEVIAEPPVEEGAVKLIEALPFPAAALTLVGAPGTVAGVIADEGVDDAPFPFELVAVTVKVYEVPFARPATVMGELDADTIKPPGLDVTV